MVHVPVSAVMVVALMRVVAARAMIEAVTVAAALAIARPMKTVAHAWGIPLSVRNAMRWNTPRWRSRNWRRRHMAKRLLSC